MADPRDHEALRAVVNDQINRNVKAGMGPVAPTRLGAATLAPWDIVGKYKAANRIADEEQARHWGHHNDHGDADRHAEWSRRMANETGPVFSTLVGLGHELEETRPRWLGGRGQPLSEAAMDTINNGQGVRASQQGRPIDPAKLQNHPISFREAVANDLRRCDDVTPDRTVYPTNRPYEGTPQEGYKDAPAEQAPRSYPRY